MIQDNVKVTGKVSFYLNGEHVKDKDNTIVTTGKNWMAAMFDSPPPNSIAAIGVGTGTTGVVSGDIALETEIARKAIASTDATLNVLTVTGTLNAGEGTGAITEAGLFTVDEVAGTHTAADDQTIMTDSAGAFVVDDLIGEVIYNVTDGSSAIITDNDTTTITGVLTGGTDNNWDTNDVYSIGSMIGRTTHGVINKESGDTLGITWEITVN